MSPSAEEVRATIGYRKSVVARAAAEGNVATLERLLCMELDARLHRELADLRDTKPGDHVIAAAVANVIARRPANLPPLNNSELARRLRKDASFERIPLDTLRRRIPLAVAKVGKLAEASRD